MDDQRRANGVAQLADTDLAIVVVKRVVGTEKIPEIEQILSTGAVCLTLLNAAQASGWGATWLTGWAVTDPAMAHDGLGLAEGEWVAGIVHIGTESAVPPERPRPDVGALVTWLDR